MVELVMPSKLIFQLLDFLIRRGWAASFTVLNVDIIALSFACGCEGGGEKSKTHGLKRG